MKFRYGALSAFTGIALLAGGPASATFDSGNDLHTRCVSTQPMDRVACAYYVSAIADVIQTNNNTLYGYSVCVPPQVTRLQVADVVGRWLTNNPQHRHYTANSLVAAALEQAYPCRPDAPASPSKPSANPFSK